MDAWIAMDKNGLISIYLKKPIKCNAMGWWAMPGQQPFSEIKLDPKFAETINKNKKISWEDEEPKSITIEIGD